MLHYYILTWLNQGFARSNPGGCSAWGSVIQDYCDDGDQQCCGPNVWSDSPPHHQYFQKYGGDIVGQLRHITGADAQNNNNNNNQNNNNAINGIISGITNGINNLIHPPS